ncbi:hypothetical protein FOA52_006861 [Chlamydomonas sp. UWO 241]|nr:hypothetical protein FOA52_006861 [Chlamydomonas sp. UWO 241]
MCACSDNILMLRDAWRLLVAGRNAASWNVRGSHAALEAEIDCGLETGLGSLLSASRSMFSACSGATSFADAANTRHSSTTTTRHSSNAPSVRSTGAPLPRAARTPRASGSAQHVHIAQQPAHRGGPVFSDNVVGGEGRPKAPPHRSYAATGISRRSTMRASVSGGGPSPWAGAISRAQSGMSVHIGGSHSSHGDSAVGGSAAEQLAAVIATAPGGKGHGPRGSGSAHASGGARGSPGANVGRSPGESAFAYGGGGYGAVADGGGGSPSRVKVSKSTRFDEGTLKNQASAPTISTRGGGTSTGGRAVSFANGSSGVRNDGNNAGTSRAHANISGSLGHGRGGGGGGGGRSGGGTSVVGTAAAVAELDAFFEADAGAVTLHSMTDGTDLHDELMLALGSVDLRRSGRVAGGAARTALGSRLPPDTLSPYELNLLSSMAPVPPLGSSPLAGSLRACEVDVMPFVADAVSRVEDWQRELMHTVYETARGVKAMLWQLYLQIRPLPAGCIVDAGVIVVQDPPPGKSDYDYLVESMPPLSLDEGLNLLGVMVENVLHLPTKLPLLVGCGILMEAAHEACEATGSGHEVNVWSSFVAHMLHVYLALAQRQAT